MTATLTPWPRIPASWAAFEPMWVTPHALSYSRSPVEAAVVTGSIVVTVPSISTDLTPLAWRSPGIDAAGIVTTMPLMRV